MGALRVPVSSSFAPTEHPAYTGNLIDSLFEMVAETAEQANANTRGNEGAINLERRRRACSIRRAS